MKNYLNNLINLINDNSFQSYVTIRLSNEYTLQKQDIKGRITISNFQGCSKGIQ